MGGWVEWLAITDTLQLRDLAMATIFGFLYMWCTLAPPGKYN